MSDRPIQRLYEALVRGDQPALDEELLRLRARLLAVAKRRLREQDAEAAVQDTLTTLWEKRDSVRDADHLLPFAFRTLRNKIGLSYLRADRRRAREQDTPGIEELRANPETASPEHAYTHGELERALREAIDVCAAENPTWGQILSRLRDGLTPAEIRLQLGDVSAAALHTRICRARKRLRQILKERHQIEL